MKTLRCILSVVFIIVSIDCSAQFQSMNSNGFLFVTTDKTLYLPGETIWFSGFVVPQFTLDSNAYQADILSIGILRQDTIGFSYNKNYLIAANRCTGSLDLPNTLEPGSYELVATLNLVGVDGRPHYEFRKRITIKSPVIQPFQLAAEVSKISADSVSVKIHAGLSTGALHSDNQATIEYHVYGGKSTVQQLPKNGRVRIMYPLKSIDQTMPVLYTHTKINGYVRSFTVRLPVNSASSTVENSQASEDSLKTVRLVISKPLAGDTLYGTILSTTLSNVRLVIANQSNVEIDTSSLIMVTGRQKITLPLQAFPYGLYTLRVMDEAGKLLDSQPFYARYAHAPIETITLSKSSYSTREKVTANILLKDENGEPLTGVLTVRCVNLNRLEYKNKVSLPEYYRTTMLKKFDGKNRSGMGSVNHQYEVLTKKTIRGSVLNALDSSRIAQPVNIILSTSDGMTLLDSDSTGSFYPTPQQLTVVEGTPFSMVVTKQAGSKQHTPYVIDVADPMAAAMALIQKPTIAEPLEIESNQTDDSLRFKSPSEGNLLQTVTIKGVKSSLESDGIYGNRCGDYVCKFDILNCFAHIRDQNNRLPVKGEKYWGNAPKNTPKFIKAEKTIYKGCIADQLHMVFKDRPFIGFDYSQWENTATAKYLSTLFWKPLTTIAGNANIEFYTSDLTGTYQIIVEGITLSGTPIYAEREFTVGFKR